MELLHEGPNVVINQVCELCKGGFHARLSIFIQNGEVADIDDLSTGKCLNVG